MMRVEAGPKKREDRMKHKRNKVREWRESDCEFKAGSVEPASLINASAVHPAERHSLISAVIAPYLSYPSLSVMSRVRGEEEDDRVHITNTADSSEGGQVRGEAIKQCTAFPTQNPYMRL